jgi:hypothetical protein
MPSAASASQAATQACICLLQLTSVSALPSRTRAALPSGTSMSSSTSPRTPHSVLCSM